MDMGEYFPYPGPCDRMKASTVLPGGDVSIAVPAVMVRYGAVQTNPGGMVRDVSGTVILGDMEKRV